MADLLAPNDRVCPRHRSRSTGSYPRRAVGTGVGPYTTPVMLACAALKTPFPRQRRDRMFLWPDGNRARLALSYVARLLSHDISRRYLMLGLRSQNAHDLPLAGDSAMPGL
jgi:hypothetical protein